MLSRQRLRGAGGGAQASGGGGHVRRPTLTPSWQPLRRSVMQQQQQQAQGPMQASCRKPSPPRKTRAYAAVHAIQSRVHARMLKLMIHKRCHSQCKLGACLRSLCAGRRLPLWRPARRSSSPSCARHPWQVDGLRPPAASQPGERTRAQGSGQGRAGSRLGRASRPRCDLLQQARPGATPASQPAGWQRVAALCPAHRPTPLPEPLPAVTTPRPRAQAPLTNAHSINVRVAPATPHCPSTAPTTT